MDIHSVIFEILQELEQKLNEEDVLRAREYLSYNENGVAFELICTQIIEYELKVSRNVFDKLNWIAKEMRLQAEFLEKIVIDE
jgi:hypothetical protein